MFCFQGLEGKNNREPTSVNTVTENIVDFPNPSRPSHLKVAPA